MYSLLIECIQVHTFLSQARLKIGTFQILFFEIHGFYLDHDSEQISVCQTDPWEKETKPPAANCTEEHTFPKGRKAHHSIFFLNATLKYS